MEFMGHSIAAWIGFNLLIIGLLALDLGVFHRTNKVIPASSALKMTAFYVALALAFGAYVYVTNDLQGDHGKALQFLTGYFIEYALSMDNIMVFVVILAHFQVPPQYQMRVLLWGILGALVLRAIFIFAGVAIISAFEWVTVILGLFLILTGVKSLMHRDEAPNIEDNTSVKLARKIWPVASHYDGEKFFTRDLNGKLLATPLFLVLIVLNITDIIFAVDSIPAVFAITSDPFIVYTSNVFAVLGLRLLYFALSGMLDRFRYLKVGLSLTLVFIGFKMVFNYPEALPDIPTEWALAITAALIFGSIFASWIWAPSEPKQKEQLR